MVWYGTFYFSTHNCGREKSDWVFVHKVVSISIVYDNDDIDVVVIEEYTCHDKNGEVW